MPSPPSIPTATAFDRVEASDSVVPTETPIVRSTLRLSLLANASEVETALIAPVL